MGAYALLPFYRKIGSDAYKMRGEGVRGSAGKDKKMKHQKKHAVSPKGVAPVRGRRPGPVGVEHCISEDAVVSIGGVGGMSSIFSGFRLGRSRRLAHHSDTRPYAPVTLLKS